MKQTPTNQKLHQFLIYVQRSIRPPPAQEIASGKGLQRTQNWKQQKKKCPDGNSACRKGGVVQGAPN